jgi:hypothetical protein
MRTAFIAMSIAASEANSLAMPASMSHRSPRSYRSAALRVRSSAAASKMLMPECRGSEILGLSGPELAELGRQRVIGEAS